MSVDELFWYLLGLIYPAARLHRHRTAHAAGAGLEHDTERPDLGSATEGYRRRFDGAGRIVVERQTELVLRFLGGVASGPLDVLDVGGGHAQTVGPLTAAGHRVVVQASAAEGLRLARPYLGAPPQAAACVSTLWELPFADGAFDVACAVRLLAHVTRWRELLREMARVSRRYLVIDFPAHVGAQRLSRSLFAAKRYVEGNTRPFFLYSRAEVEGELAALGFRVRAWDAEFVMPVALHRAARMPAVSARLERALSGTGLTEHIGSPILLLAERR